MITTIISIIVSFIELMLATRFAFRLLGANPSSGFVAWVYNVSHPLAAPFLGIFGEPSTVTGTVVSGVLELGTLIGIMVYAVIGYAVIRILTAAGPGHIQP